MSFRIPHEWLQTELNKLVFLIALVTSPFFSMITPVLVRSINSCALSGGEEDSILSCH
jgi:hypothetical protein